MDFVRTHFLDSDRRRLVFRPIFRFLVALCLLDGLSLSFAEKWERYSPDDYRERVRRCRELTPDFVLVGGSPVSEGLDPSLLSGFNLSGQELRQGYSLGLPGGTMTDFFHAVRHGCVKPPKVLIYGATASDINDSRNEPHGAYSLITRQDWIETAELRPEAAEWTTRHYLQGRSAKSWGAFRYRHGIRMWAAANAERTFPGCCPTSAHEAEEGRPSTL